MSVMNGFRAELFDKIVGLNGHAVIQGYDGRLPDWQRIADAAKKHARRDLRTAADRAAADGDRQRPLRRRAGARHAGRGHPLQQDHHGNVLAGDISRSRPDSNRVAIGSRARRNARRFPGQPDHLVEPGRALDRRRHGPARGHLYRRRDLRGRDLRLRQGFRGHADAGCAAVAVDGRPGRDDRDPDERPGQGRADHGAAPPARPGPRR